MAKIIRSNSYDYEIEQRSDHWKSDAHPVRHRGINVTTDKGVIDIPASSIREHTGNQRVSEGLLNAVKDFFSPGKTIDASNPLRDFKKK